MIIFANKRLLTKGDYLRGLQCHKLAWHTTNAKNLIPEPDQQARAVFEEGQKVGQLAWKLFPGGMEIRGDDFDHAVTLSEQALQQRRPLFEPALTFNRCCIRADILVPAGGDSWDLIEIKSTTSVEGVHIHDLAFQAHVLAGAGLRIRRYVLAFIDSTFVKHGPIDPRQFFVQRDVTDSVSALSRDVEAKVEELFRNAGLQEAPAIQIGRHCDQPHQCPLREGCWKHLPVGNITQLHRAGPKRFQLLALGILNVADIPEDFKLTDHQQIQRQAAKTGTPHVNRPAIRAFLKQLQYPLSFLDFESYAPAIPLHDGTRPYQQVCFQFSLHIVRSPGVEPEHFSFLADGTGDPRLEFMRSLRDSMPPKGSVVAFNSAFEVARLRECSASLPEFQTWVKDIENRVVDLLIPFRRFQVYHPLQNGCCSMKSILPALCGKNYHHLGIQNGAVASSQFLRVMFGDVHDPERCRIRDELHRYCQMDTIAMIEIIEALRVLASPPNGK